MDKYLDNHPSPPVEEKSVTQAPQQQGEAEETVNIRNYRDGEVEFGVVHEDGQTLPETRPPDDATLPWHPDTFEAYNEGEENALSAKFKHMNIKSEVNDDEDTFLLDSDNMRQDVYYKTIKRGKTRGAENFGGNDGRVSKAGTSVKFDLPPPLQRQERDEKYMTNLQAAIHFQDEHLARMSTPVQKSSIPNYDELKGMKVHVRTPMPSRAPTNVSKGAINKSPIMTPHITPVSLSTRFQGQLTRENVSKHGAFINNQGGELSHRSHVPYDSGFDSDKAFDSFERGFAAGVKSNSRKNPFPIYEDK
ncbi:unnamed protein product, partial [Owenia fusiformis]